jgi:hypothetical protein
MSRLFWIALLGLSVAGSAVAQSTYRWTDPATGRTVFSDTPPPAGARNVQQKRGDANSEPAQAYAAKRTSGNNPVTLYTTANCQAECQEARQFLKQRKVPFTEKEVATQAALDEMKARFGGTAMVPSLAVGKEQTAGFQADNWNRLLDQAGFPGGR